MNDDVAHRADAAEIRFGLDNSYVRDLGEGFCVRQQPAAPLQPELLFLNTALARELDLPDAALQGATATRIFSAQALPADADPVAQAYAGHQFGGLSPQLGDGRALLIGEKVDGRGRRHDLMFKGSGRTPFSRGGDGLATVGPMLREVLMGEALHALGIPTTRALAVARTGRTVFREQPQAGAVLTRVADSHLRVGTFQYFAIRQDLERLQRLADYAVARHDPQLLSLPAPRRYMALLDAVMTRQAQLVAQWMNVGFIHGVMNTDNMTISGQTIDYGPCAFMEHFDPAAVFSSIDHQGRYAYGNQPAVAQWNLARLAETLLPLIAEKPQDAVDEVTERIRAFGPRHDAFWLSGQCAKLGLRDAGQAGVVKEGAAQALRALVTDWLELLRAQRVDYTLAHRRLADVAELDGGPRERERGPLHELFSVDPPALDAWLQRWGAMRKGDSSADSGVAVRLPAATVAQRMRAVNPAVIARNHHVEHALQSAAEAGDMAPFHALLEALSRPFDPALQGHALAQPADAAFTAGYRTFCGT